MIIARTPFRVSFLGGGTDYPAWYRKHGGAVLATTIDKYCYITCRYLPPFHEHRITRRLLEASECCNPIDEINHPAAREVLRVPAASTAASRSTRRRSARRAAAWARARRSPSVCCTRCTRCRAGWSASSSWRAESMHLEQDILKEAVGSQDQVSAAYGGLNHVLFHPNGEISVRPGHDLAAAHGGVQRVT